MNDKKMEQDVSIVLEYLWHDEERHYQECEKDTKGHIFLVLKRLAKNIGYKYDS